VERLAAEQQQQLLLGAEANVNYRQEPARKSQPRLARDGRDLELVVGAAAQKQRSAAANAVAE
jgi:hypothetical protein